MKSGVLLDTGPLVAYLYPRDQHHNWATEQFRTLDLPFISCEPVLTEACFLIARNGQSPARLLEMLSRGAIRIAFSVQDELASVHRLIERYSDVPMSLADACLVRLAELTGLPICTLDSDFDIYRIHGRRQLQLVMPRRWQLHEP